MDWTLLIDRQAANCRNTSDEVFPRIYLGDRYEKYLYPLTFISPYLLLKKLNRTYPLSHSTSIQMQLYMTK